MAEAKEKQKPVRVRIQSADGIGYSTTVTDVETGKAIDHVMRVELDIRPDHAVTAILTVWSPVIEIIADAEIRNVCPCCGRPVE